MAFLRENQSGLEESQYFFTRVVAVAEKEGKPVSLLVVPGTSVFDSIMVTAQRLQSDTIVCGRSNKLSTDEQAKLTGDAWERLPEPRPRVTLEIIAPDGATHSYHLGPHAPQLRPEDIELLHRMWLEVSQDPKFARLHHYDVLALALKELQQEMDGPRRQEMLAMLEEQLRRNKS